MNWKRGWPSAILLLCLTALSLAVHGYHLGVEDQAIYLPAIKKQLNPSLYPHDSAFFEEQTRPTLFDELIALSVRASGLPLDVAIFSWQVLSVLLVLAGCRQVGRRCFFSPSAQWAGVVMVASLLTLPVAGTALYLMDPYLHPRSVSTVLLLFAIVAALDGRRAAAFGLAAAAALVHPLMALFGVGLLVFLLWRPGLGRTLQAPALALAIPLLSGPHSEAWREAARTRTYFYLLEWQWYEWLGIVAPLALLWWFASLGRRSNQLVLARLCSRLAWFGLAGFVAGLVITLPPQMMSLAALQPMRYLHLVYLLLFLLGGGLLGQWVLRDKPWRWLLLFVPLCAVMLFAQRQLFSGSGHVEWPRVRSTNSWLQAFEWVRQNTPPDALFALGPRFLERLGEDFHGFRGLAERSRLADAVKDPAPVALFPPLAPLWQRQVRAQTGWAEFQAPDFRRIKKEYGVGWVVVERANLEGLACPYGNGAVFVCRVE